MSIELKGVGSFPIGGGEEEFLNGQTEPKFTAAEFMRLFAATLDSLGVSLHNEGKISFDRKNLADFMVNCKGNNKYPELLLDFEFKTNWQLWYSTAMDDAITRLKFDGRCYVINVPGDEMYRVYVNRDTEETNSALNSFPQYREEMMDFAFGYIIFEVQNGLPLNERDPKGYEKVKAWKEKPQV